MTPEGKVLAGIVRHLERLKRDGVPVKWRKLHGSAMQAGLPDLLIVLRGMAVLCEVKRPGKRATALQAHELSEWGAAGALAFEADSVEAFATALASPRGAGECHA